MAIDIDGKLDAPACACISIYGCRLTQMLCETTMEEATSTAASLGEALCADDAMYVEHMSCM